MLIARLSGCRLTLILDSPLSDGMISYGLGVLKRSTDQRKVSIRARRPICLIGMTNGLTKQFACIAEAR